MSCSHPQEDADDSESNSICNTTFFVILIPVAFSFLILWKRFGVKLYEIVTCFVDISRNFLWNVALI